MTVRECVCVRTHTRVYLGGWILSKETNCKIISTLIWYCTLKNMTTILVNSHSGQNFPSLWILLGLVRSFHKKNVHMWHFVTSEGRTWTVLQVPICCLGVLPCNHCVRKPVQPTGRSKGTRKMVLHPIASTNARNRNEAILNLAGQMSLQLTQPHERTWVKPAEEITSQPTE